MNFNFVPMNEQYARCLIDSWKYDGIYECYSYIYERDHIMDASLWGVEIFAVQNDEGELIGETTIEFYDNKDEYVERTEENREKLLDSTMWIGFQLRPDLTGKGIGSEFVKACVEFAIRKNNYKGKIVRLAVYEFNERARKAYEKAGFEIIEKITNSEGKTVMFMGKRIEMLEG